MIDDIICDSVPCEVTRELIEKYLEEFVVQKINDAYTLYILDDIQDFSKNNIEIRIPEIDQSIIVYKEYNRINVKTRGYISDLEKNNKIKIGDKCIAAPNYTESKEPKLQSLYGIYIGEGNLLINKYLNPIPVLNNLIS